MSQEQRAQLIAKTLETLQQFARTDVVPRRMEFVAEAMKRAGRLADVTELQDLQDFITIRIEGLRNRQRLLQIQREAEYELQMHRFRTFTGPWGSAG